MKEPQTTPTDFAKAGDIVDIPSLGKRTRAPDNVRYRYTDSATMCPICGDIGVPWGGWFTCDSRGCCVALVSTGEVFTPGISAQ